MAASPEFIAFLRKYRGLKEAGEVEKAKELCAAHAKTIREASLKRLRSIRTRYNRQEPL